MANFAQEYTQIPHVCVNAYRCSAPKERFNMKKIVTATLIVAALLLTSHRASAQAMDPVTLIPRTGADFDLYFMRNIITNHQIDIELTRSAATNASHTPLKDLALSIMDKRQQEADQLIGWLNDWYHNQPDTSMTNTLIHMRAMPGMNMGSLNEALHQIADLDQLQGDGYDKQLMLYLIHDHQLAITAAQLVPARAARPELKPFATSLIAEEQGEIDQFTAWLGQWYQVDSRGLPLTHAATNAPASPTSPPAAATSPAAPTATLAASATNTANPPTPTNNVPDATVALPSTSTSAPPTAFIAASDTATPTRLAPAPAAAVGDNSGLWISIAAVVVAAIVLLGWMALRRRPPLA